jgi:acetoin:2,6-dichlorophenolindophenol oxidoreductase subunit alpha
VWTVREAAARALVHARSGDGPAFIEAITYRYVGHSRSDPGAYRPEGELDEWRARDPIVVLRAQLEADGAAPAALDDLERDVAAQLEQMRERGLAAPFPTALVTSEFQD